MPQSRTRDWFVTLYPLAYAKATEEEIASKEGDWLHELDHGIVRIDAENKLTYILGVMERGAKENKLHCHYRLYFKNAVSRSRLQVLFGTHNHFKPTESKPGCTKYMMDKAGLPTTVGGPWTEGDAPTEGDHKQKVWASVRDLVKSGASDAEILDAHPFAASNWKAVTVFRTAFPTQTIVPATPTLAYQTEVLTITSGSPTRRQWIWVWSHETNVGKTELGTALIERGPGLKCSMDMRSILYQFKPQHRVLVFDLPRLTSLTDSFLSMLEELSDGTYHTSDKYESLQKYVFCHIVILTNHPPPMQRYGDRIKEVYAKLDK